MSHFVTIQTRILDLEALEDACTELGVELHHDTEARGYANQSRHGDLVIRLKGPYDIAANREDSSDDFEPYTLTTDRDPRFLRSGEALASNQRDRW